MPKPFFIARPSGLFVRFLIPQALRKRLGARYFLRRLYTPDPDRARLVAARMGAALSDGFDRLRGDPVAEFDFDETLRKLQKGYVRDLTVRDVVLPDGTRLGTVEINTPEDEASFSRLRQSASPNPVAVVPVAPSSATAATPEPVSPPGTLRLLDAINAYLDKRKAAKLGATTGDADMKATLAMFAEMVGNKPITAIDDNDLMLFDKARMNWPMNARLSARYVGMKAPEVVRDSLRRQTERDPDLKLIGDAAQRKHRDNLAAFFNDLVRRKKLPSSPMQKEPRQQSHRIERRQVRRPFNATELARIFDPATFGPWAKDKPHYYWAPWLALYSGARLNEVAQIYLNDIQTIHDIPGFAIGAFRPDQRVKTASSVRFVPFARALIDAGLLIYVEEVRAAGHFRLFPHLKHADNYGDYLGDRFTEYLKDIGLKTSDNPDAQGMGFHWFRHTVSHAMVNLPNANVLTAASVTGHGSRGLLPGELSTYVQPTDLRARFDAINGMNLPAPPNYTPGMFAEALKAAHDLSRKREHAATKKRATSATAAPKGQRRIR